jgi:chitinase
MVMKKRAYAWFLVMALAAFLPACGGEGDGESDGDAGEAEIAQDPDAGDGADAWDAGDDPVAEIVPDGLPETAARAADDGAAEPDAPPGNDFRVVGYYPSWQDGVSEIQFEYLTHINYAFILPTSSGGLTGLADTSLLDELVGLAHARGVLVSISVGGWNDGDDSAFHALAAGAGTRTAFVGSIADFVADHDLDGADIDWEYPDPDESAGQYVLLMEELAGTLHGSGKILTAAVVAGPWNGDGILDAVFDAVDFLNLMAYDGGTPHSPYSLAEQSLDYWRGRGLPQNKAVLGVPFYGRSPYTPYRDLVDMDPDAPNKDQVGDIHYNGIPTIQAKTALAADEGSGIMIWELSMDTDDETSLLRAIYEAIPTDWTLP